MHTNFDFSSNLDDQDADEELKVCGEYLHACFDSVRSCIPVYDMLFTYIIARCCVYFICTYGVCM